MSEVSRGHVRTVYTSPEFQQHLHQELDKDYVTRLDFTILRRKLQIQVALHLLVERRSTSRRLKRRQAKLMLIGLVSDGHREHHTRLARRLVRDHHGPNGISEGLCGDCVRHPA
jgi:hypothetical protein